MNADRVTIESDDRGFELHVVDEDGERHIFNIQDIAEEVYDAVKREIGPWLYERDQARREYDSGVSGIPELQPILTKVRELDPDAWPDPDEIREQADHARKAAKENQ